MYKREERNIGNCTVGGSVVRRCGDGTSMRNCL